MEHLIHKLEMDLPPDLNLKEAIRFLTRAWNSVTSETIYNCWKHTGIMASAVPEGESSPDPSSQLADLLAVPSMSRTHPMSARQFLSVDDELETGETLTDDDIVSLVASSEDSEDDDDHCETEPEQTQCIPSSTEARQALSLLQVFFGPPEGGPILFLLSPEVSGTSVTMSIYIICQQHGGHKVGKKSFGYISVKFIRLLLILSAKSLFDQKSSSKYYFSQ